MRKPWFHLADRLQRRLEQHRLNKRWDGLRAMGMQIAPRVFLPASTWIDESFCFLISIGERSGFGERCSILAHDAQMNEFTGASRAGRVVIHPSSHIGGGSIILPGVEIGPRTIVAAGSVVSRSLPADTVCGGNPARVLCSLDEYLERQRGQIESCPHFDSRQVGEQKAEILRAVAEGDAYMITEPRYSERLREWSADK